MYRLYSILQSVIYKISFYLFYSILLSPSDFYSHLHFLRFASFSIPTFFQFHSSLITLFFFYHHIFLLFFLFQSFYFITIFFFSHHGSRLHLSLTLEFIQSEGKYDGNTVNRCRSVKKSARQLGNPRDVTLEKKSARWVWASVSD